MILVDIGNSGIRAVHVAPSSSWIPSQVVRLSWNASLHVRGKPNPNQHSTENQRWCDVDDDAAFFWFVEQFAKHEKETWWVSSVHQNALDLLMRVLHQALEIRSVNRVVHQSIPMAKQVEFPEKTGIDRLLSAWEAWNFVNGSGLSSERSAVLVVQAGTALTVDCVSEDGAYLGGAIAPGLGLSLQLLAAGTDQLPWLGNHQVTAEPRLPGKNTAEAIAAGVHASLAGGARFLIERYRSEATWRCAPIVVTGGDAELLVPYLPTPCHQRDYLVLRGLYRLAMG